MTPPPSFPILLVCTPGLEPALADEVRERGFVVLAQIAGGIETRGDWRDVWRANLELRGAAKVLARIGSFRALHLAQLDKRARAFAWRETLRPDVAFRVEASCARSRIYHSKAAAQRVEKAIMETLGAPLSDEAEVVIKVRIEDDLVTLSLDTSGDGLHKRGAKQAMAKAPMRETMAALFLRQCKLTGLEPVLDPMCGSGTFVIEAAEMAAGLLPGRNRHFAFELLANFDGTAWQALRATRPGREIAQRFFGSDRDAGAIVAATANSVRAGVAEFCSFQQATISAISPPPGPPGLVIMNPPYGARIGDKQKLSALYASLGRVLREKFPGWRVGLITNDEALARATGLKFKKSAPILHGGLRVWLYQAQL